MEETSLILIKGEPKTQQVVSITKDNKGVFWIKFQSGKSFPYSGHDICVLKAPKEINVSNFHF